MFICLQCAFLPTDATKPLYAGPLRLCFRKKKKKKARGVFNLSCRFPPATHHRDVTLCNSNWRLLPCALAFYLAQLFPRHAHVLYTAKKKEKKTPPMICRSLIS